MLNTNALDELEEKEDLLEYKNSELSPEVRVADLISRMTLEEKAAQMLCI